ncbi:SusC/RagA family TonB-linked outer membrane protein [Chitinophaga defluvii]|uniref:SusC/RagA family TonB-linked outer membrane protein n=1 Tax=Chitinophaga defluvii TaxID=3163343 RepID=A0ABV2TCD7_9BACT
MDKIIHTNDGLCPYLKESRPVKWKNRFKYIVAMKLFLLLLALSFHLSAKVFSQQISLNAKEESLRSVLRSIKKQSGYGFLLGSSVLKEAKPVTITLHLYSVEDALKKIFETQNLTYSIDNKFITIKPKADKKKELTPAPLSFRDMEQKTVQGTVTDSKNEPLIGVNVRVKGKTIGTITNNEGHYSISLDPTDILVFSYIGYVTLEIPVKNQVTVNAKLVEFQSQLDETVVKGYYNTTKILNTGSVSSIKADDIAKQPVSDPLMALEGRIPGLYVAQTSGITGAGISVMLRGQNSINNGNGPFYVVDGIPFNSNNLSQNKNAALANLSPLASIRPEDIESIDVLKDADATAIYGSRGANGVILITTKKGSVGKTKVDINLNHGIGKVTRRLDLMNTDQYLNMRRQAYINDGLPVPTSSTPADFSNYDLTTWDSNRFTDWQKEMIGGTANFTNATATLSGGSAQTQFLLGSSYRRETSVFPGDYNNEIGSANLNVRHSSENNKFNAEASINFSNNNNRLPQTDFTSYIFLAPNTPKIYNPDGSVNWENSTFDNPFGQLKQSSTAISENLIGNVILSYNVMKNLQIKTNLGYNSNRIDENNIYPFSSIDPATPDPASNRVHIYANNQIKSWIIEPQITYSLSFKNHHIESLLGTTFQQTRQNGFNQTASGFSNDALINNISAATTFSNTKTINTLYRYNAIYARIGYNYLDKYVLNLTGRRDGSSRFGPGKQFGNFGAIGAAWIFNKEDFIENSLPFLSRGKLRASIGKTGNDQLGDYKFLSTYTPSSASYFGVSALNPTKLTNPNFGWETINKIEVATELGFLKNRIQLDVSWYRNRTSNQLVGYSLPFSTGFDNIIANLPAVIQNKGWEFALTTTNIDRGNLIWTSSINLTIPQNKLVSYPNLEGSAYKNRYVIGMPLSIYYLYTSTGIDNKTGLYTFEDLNNDGSINSPTDQRPYFVGQKYFGGVSNTFYYKGLSLDIFFQFVKQNGYNFLTWGLLPGYFNGNQQTELLDSWKSSGDNAKYQRYSTLIDEPYNSNDRYNSSNARITDASFIRLKNVQLSWSIPKKWMQKIRANNAKVYFQGQNLFTITRFKGLDPETQRIGINPTLPPLRVFTVGLQLSL